MMQEYSEIVMSATLVLNGVGQITILLETVHIHYKVGFLNHSETTVRFRRLLLLDTKFIKTAVDTIIVCCIFNNICIINDDILDQYIVDGREEENNPGVH